VAVFVRPVVDRDIDSFPSFYFDWAMTCRDNYSIIFPSLLWCWRLLAELYHKPDWITWDNAGLLSTTLQEIMDITDYMKVKLFFFGKEGSDR
jgi:hypothetical protein